MFAIYCIIGFYNATKGQNPIISIKTIAYITFTYIAIANVNLVLIAATPKNVTYKYIVIQYIKDATLIFCVGAVFILMGIELIINKGFPKLTFDLNKRQIDNYFYLAVFALNRFTLSFFNLTFLGAIVKIFVAANLLAILFFARLWIKENSNKYRNYTFILYFTTTLFALMYAFLRIEIIMPTVVLFFGLISGYGNIKFLLSYKVIPFILIFILFSSVFSDLGKYRGTISNLDIISNALSSQQDEVNDNNYQGDLAETQKATLMERSANIAQLTQVERLVRKNGFYGGTASEPLIIALIPRFLWPEKPFIELGTWFALESGIGYKADVNSRVNNSVNMTIQGELYLDFGWYGVIIGCLLIGMFYSLLWNATGFHDSDYNIIGTIFGGYLIIIVLSGFGADLQIVITLFSTYIIFYIVKRLL